MKICINEMVISGTLLNPDTKKYNNFMRAYMMSDYDNINDVYIKPSARKRKAFDNIVYNTASCGYTYRYRIISYNKFHFTIGYAVLANNRTIYIVIETSRNTYILPLANSHYSYNNLVSYITTCVSMYQDM